MLNQQKKYKQYLIKEKYRLKKNKKGRYKKYSKKIKYKLLNILIFAINIILLCSNIFLLFIRVNKRQKTVSKKSTPISFKNSEYFSLNFLNKTYQYISAYFHSKYNTNNKMNFKENNSTEKKVIKLKITGFVNSQLPWLTERLKDNFILEINSPNPDYLIYNVYNQEDLTENNRNIDAIRIALFTENEYPDMNTADYFLANYHVNYFDRYFKMNIFFWENFKEIDAKRLEVLKSPIRKKFCAAVISNCGSVYSFRLRFIDKLGNNYKKVDMGGGCNHNINRRVWNKIEFLNEYKFSIAMENSRGDGYISEKIVDSFRAGTIPIYYGDYLVDEFINPKTYILIRGDKDIDAKIEYIKKIDNDDKLYMEIMKEKPIIDDKFKEKIDNKEIKEFFYNIFSQDKNKAYRRDDNFYDFNCNLDCRK